MMRHFLALCIFLVCCHVSFAADRPNIIVILADDMGWGDLGCYPKGKAWGQAAYTPTPNLDALAASGVQCMQGYATAMVCSPSRAGLISGQNQQRWGFYGFEETLAPIPTDLTTLPEALKEAGYATGMFGKWHLSVDPDSLPLKRGFDRFFGFLGGQHDYFDAAIGQTFHGVGYAPDAYVIDQDQPVKKIKYMTDEFTDRAIEFMDATTKQSKPFFVYLPYNAPHPPHQAPWSILSPYAEKWPGKKLVPRDGARAMIISLDQNIGRITKWLRDQGLERDTLIFFSSDNGGSDGGPARMLQHNGGLKGRKSTYYEGGIREPYIVRWPAKLPAGLKYDKPVSQLDIFATAVAVAGAPVPQQKLDGVNLIPYLTGENKDAPHTRLYWGLARPSRWAVREGDWKLVYEDLNPETLGKANADRTEEFKLQLYDVAADPKETKDLAAEMPDKVKALQALDQQFRSECKPSIYTAEVEAKHKAALTARAADPKLKDLSTAFGAPGHWYGGGAAERAKRDPQE